MTPRDPLEPTIAALRRLARGLLYDAHGAEDVVQEAWLAALRAPTASARSGGWLTETVRRLAFNRRREEARRHAREVRAARGEAQPAVDEAAGRTEVLRGVLDALDRLPEPYRETVALRYLDDLAPREIARRRSLPVNTVRTHLRRGLERLRADLEGEEGRDRRDWLAALVAFAGPPVPALHPLSADSSLPGGLSMKTLATSVLALPLVVLGTWYGFVHEPRSPVPEPVTSPQATVASGPGEITAPTQDTGTRTPVETTRAADEGWTLRGRVSRGKREPFPGARVLGRVYAGTAPEGEPLVEATVLADESGEYAFTIAPPEQLVCVSVEPGEPSVGRYQVYDVFGPGDAPTSPWNLQVYAADARVLGTVLGPDGAPIAGARVIHQRRDDPRPPEDVTDASGHFTLPASSVLGIQSWYVVAEGMAVGRIDQDLVPGDQEIEVTLTPERRVRGRIVDEERRPLADVQVATITPEDVAPVLTGPDGRFEIGGIDLARVQRRRESLAVRKAGYHQGPRRTIEPHDLSPDVEVEIVLKRGIDVSGRVVDGDGTPVPGTWVSVGYGTVPPHITYTDEEGRFTLPSLWDGNVELWFWRVGFAEVRRDVFVPPPALGTVDEIEVVLPPPHFLAGVVQDADGEPIPYAMIWVGDADDEARPRVAGFQQNADAQGRFRFEGLPDVPLELTVLEKDSPPLHQRVEPVDRDDVVLQVGTGVGLRGLVLDDHGAPVPSFTVSVAQRLDGQALDWKLREVRPFDSADGTWELEPRVPAGLPYLVDVRASGFRPGLVRVTSGLEPDANVARLSRGATVNGRVVDVHTGEPVAEAQVRILTERERGLPSTQTRTTATDDQGRFALEGIESGPATLQVVGEGIAHVDGPFEIEGGAPVDRTIRVGGPGRIAGRVFSLSGQPVANVPVQAYGTEVVGSERQHDTTTDAEGLFAFEDLDPGLYLVGRMVTTPGGSMRDVSRSVVLGADEELHIELRPGGTAALQVRLLCSTTETPTEVLVGVSPILPLLARFLPDAPCAVQRAEVLPGDGGRIEGVCGGRSSANATARLADGTQVMGHASVDIAESGAAEVTIELLPRR